MKAVILAAGIGSRIRPLTDDIHKSLLKIGDSTILYRMLTNIKDASITDVIIVTGYLEDMVQAFVTENFPSLTFTFVHNEKYLETNTGYSLMLTKEAVGDEAFVKFDADVVFEQAVLEKLLTHQGSTALCVDTKIHLEAEEVKVELDENGRVVKVGKTLAPHTAQGESIGIEKIGRDAGKLLFAELERLMRNPKNYNEYYDDSYTTLVNEGVLFSAVNITGLKWVEIDTHEDYKKAVEIFT